jgi:large subunit ribosomal protein L25
MNSSILHVDFYEVEAGVTLQTKISIHIFGNPVGVRDGGILEVPIREIEISCLPKDLPERVVVDVSNLAVNQVIHVRDLGLSEGVRLITPGDQVVAVVKFSRATEAAPAEAEAPAAAPATAPKAAAPAKK